jgi:glycosyltransferase involved in cell wall biosynthesis
LTAVDRGATRAADVVVLDTEEQRETVLAPPRGGVVVCAVGAPDWWYVPAPRPLPDAPLRVAFFGLYTPLQGAPVIGRAIALLRDEPGVEFTMVGTGQDHAETVAAAQRSPHVDWLDWLDPAPLADAVAAHHVCLGVFGTGPKALRVVPNKVYQGAAAGCVLVTSDTPPQRAMLGGAACFVPPGDADALAQTLRDLAHDPARVATMRQAAYDLATARFRPENVVAPLRERLIGGRA